ncbi:MAG: V-type ATP synthase subunit D [Bacteroidales bacterium]
MSIKFQYNKTALQSLNKQLNIRVKTLPTIKNKESALRIEVKKAKKEFVEKVEILHKKYTENETVMGLWKEFNSDLVSLENVEYSFKKIAGVKVPELKKIDFSLKDFLQFNAPTWFPLGYKLLKDFIQLELEVMILNRKVDLLEYARKKTTQKVNLYEKVQIPGYEDAIRKIKRFLEDEENLSKSAMKIVKNRTQKEKETAL